MNSKAIVRLLLLFFSLFASCLPAQARAPELFQVETEDGEKTDDYEWSKGKLVDVSNLPLEHVNGAN